MTPAIKLDGMYYHNLIIPANGIQRNFQVLDGPNSERKLSGEMLRDVIGTYYITS